MSNNYWADWKQDKRIDEAEEQLRAERRARSRLSEQMRTQQGNLQGQIDRLTRAFVALVEHEDIRAELGQYADAAGCRRYAREVVSTVVVTGGATLRGTVESADVPGYWLAAAARGVAARARGEAGGDELLAEARHRDPRRTALFQSLLSAQTRDPRWASEQLDLVLPDQPAVSAAQRQVWLAVADGRLRPPAGDAEELLVAALGRQVAAAGTPATERVTVWLEEQSGALRDMLSAERAAARLATLRQVLASGTGGRTPSEPTIAAFLGADASEQSDPGPAQEAEDPLADCLRSLVDEGSPAEGDILDRMAAVRIDLGFLDEGTATMQSAWSAPVGDVVDLLLADLEDASAPRFALACRALAPLLRTIADDLGRQAAVPIADTRPVKVVGEVITVGTDGATSSWQDGVAAGVLRRHPINPLLLPLGVALLVAGVLGVALAFVAPGWTVLALAGVLGGAGTLFAALRERRVLADLQARTRTTTDGEIEVAIASILDDRARSATAAGQAHEHLRAVRDVLGAPV